MRFKHIAAGLVAAAIAGSGMVIASTAVAAPAAAATSYVAGGGGCTYKVRNVRTRLNVRSGPSTRYRTIDKLHPNEYTWGKCKKYGQWRKVEGSVNDRLGYSHGYYLKKQGRVGR